jgi:hypothetical protein
MLVNFPLDCLSVHWIASAVSSFSKLIHWHQSSNLARQIVLVRLIPATPDRGRESRAHVGHDAG